MSLAILPSDADGPLRHRRDPSLTRVRRGAYVQRTAFAAAPAHEHHLVHVLAVAATRPTAVFARESALALASLPHGRPAEVFTIGGSSASGRRAGVVHSRAAIADEDVMIEDGIARCTPAYAIAQLARVGRQVDAVSALDEALRLQVVTKDTVTDALGRQGTRGQRRAAWVIEFADPRSQSVGESWSRVAIHRIGAPPPQLQVRILTRLGDRFPDFLWERRGMRPLGGEFDGKVKYGVIASENGKQPVDVLIAEKEREDALREHIDTLHWMWDAAQHPEKLRSLLVQARIPVASALLPGW